MLYQRFSLSERLVTEGWVDAPKPRLAEICSLNDEPGRRASLPPEYPLSR
jgi:hypothetical protein